MCAQHSVVLQSEEGLGQRPALWLTLTPKIAEYPPPPAPLIPAQSAGRTQELLPHETLAPPFFSHRPKPLTQATYPTDTRPPKSAALPKTLLPPKRLTFPLTCLRPGDRYATYITQSFDVGVCDARTIEFLMDGPNPRSPCSARGNRRRREFGSVC